MKDIISVVIPCYNVEKYLYRCLRSIEEQTYGFENIELILVNDASPDNVPGMLEAFRIKHPDNTIVINNKNNRGLSYCRNIGLSVARGKYITFVDSDDLLSEVALEVMHDKAEEYGCDIVKGRHLKFDTNVEEVFPGGGHYFCDLTDVDSRKNMIITNLECYAWGILFLREALIDNNMRFPEGYVYEDVSFALQWKLLLKRYCYVETVVYHYFQNKDGISNCGVYTSKERDYARTIPWTLEHLRKREDFDSIWETYRYEIESFIFWMSYLQPLMQIKTEMQWFKDELLKLCPEIKNSPYIVNLVHPKLRSYMEFLMEEEQDD